MCHKKGTHNCWPPHANNHLSGPRRYKKKKVGVMMETWLAEDHLDGPWTGYGLEKDAQPEAGTNPEKKDGK